MKQKVSVVIITWNGEALIKQCLGSLLGGGSLEKSGKTDSVGVNDSLDLEVILVDNGSSDRTVAVVKAEFPGVKIIKNKTNLGFSVANNQGLKKATGDLVLLLNQDVFLEREALARMVLFWPKKAKRLNLGALAPRLNYPDGRPQASCRPFPSPVNVIWDSFTGGRWHEKYYSVIKSQVVEQPMASCLLCKKEALNKAGFFDESADFFLYFNDVDLSFRIQKAGFVHYYWTGVSAIHKHGESTKKLSEKERLRFWSRGLYYFLVKHYAYGSIVRKSVFCSLVGLISALRSLEQRSFFWFKKTKSFNS